MKKLLLFLMAFALACGCTMIPGPTDGAPREVTCKSNAWGDDDGDGKGYYLTNLKIWINNDSGYPVDLSAWEGSPFDISLEKRPGDFEIPVGRVNEPGNGWLGLAKVWVNGSGAVSRAEMWFNEAYPIMEDPLIVGHVGCMEGAHNFGLHHQNTPGLTDSCMNNCSLADDWGECMREPEAQSLNHHDLEQLAIVYGTERPEEPPSCASVGLTLLISKFPAPI